MVKGLQVLLKIPLPYHNPLARSKRRNVNSNFEEEEGGKRRIGQGHGHEDGKRFFSDKFRPCNFHP
jgi:hypothetical protein